MTLAHSAGSATVEVDTSTHGTPAIVEVNGVSDSFSMSGTVMSTAVTFGSNPILTLIFSPTMPTALAVAQNSGSPSSALDVSWTDTSVDFTNIRIERSLDQSTWTAIGNATASPYLDTSLSAQTTYYYRIRAYRASDGLFSSYTSNVSAATAASGGSNGNNSNTSGTYVLFILVTDPNNTPVNGAMVGVGANFYTTDGYGIVQLGNLNAGNYDINVTASGYPSVTRTISLQQNFPLQSPYTIQLGVNSTITTSSIHGIPVATNEAIGIGIVILLVIFTGSLLYQDYNAKKKTRKPYFR